MSSGLDHHHTLAVVFGKNPDTRKSEIMVLKCRKCRFEAWASKELRDKFGKPDQSYWDAESHSIKSGIHWRDQCCGNCKHYPKGVCSLKLESTSPMESCKDWEYDGKTPIIPRNPKELRINSPEETKNVE